MLAIHLENVHPDNGKATAYLKLTLGGVDHYADAAIDELEDGIRALMKARHLAVEMRRHHTKECNECLLDAIAQDPSKT